MSAGGNTGTFVWIKLATAEHDRFVKVLFTPGSSDISDVADLACKAFPRWNLDAGQVCLILVAGAGEAKPQQPAITAALDSVAPLAEEAKLESVGVASGAWLVVKPTTTPAGSNAALFNISAAANLRELIKESVTAALAAHQDASITSTVLSDEAYEDKVRALLPGILLRKCGLETIRGADVNRHSFLGMEWDFRVPVTVAETAPHSNADPDFVVFPSRLHYIRPEPVTARNVTPTKFGGAQVPPAAHYLAIIEATVSSKWTKSTLRPGLLTRLEQRLRVSLDRAISEGVTGVTKITDLVSVVGVAAPTEYTMSVRAIMSASAGDSAPILLKELMDAGRFVFFKVTRD